MRKLPLILMTALLPLFAMTQDAEKKTPHHTAKGSQLVLNPFFWMEEHLPIGLGYTYRFTDRSEIFTDLAWVTLNPAYDVPPTGINGFRVITQYRYHFLQKESGFSQWYQKSRKANRVTRTHEAFLAFEARLKSYSFGYHRSFISKSPADTLTDYHFNARATVFAAAILYGRDFNLSRNGKWKGEVTFGIGGRQKWVNYKTVPAGYEPVFALGGWGLKPPAIDEETGMVYFPGTLRIKMRIGK